MKDSPIDLRPDHLAIVRTLLQAHAPDCEVWVFGSRTQGSAKPMSDLDLAVIAQPTDSVDLEELREAFSASSLPMKVDVVDWTGSDPSFQTIIERQKVVMQDRRRKKVY